MHESRIRRPEGAYASSPLRDRPEGQHTARPTTRSPGGALRRLPRREYRRELCMRCFPARGPDTAAYAPGLKRIWCRPAGRRLRAERCRERMRPVRRRRRFPGRTRLPGPAGDSAGTDDLRPDCRRVKRLPPTEPGAGRTNFRDCCSSCRRRRLGRSGHSAAGSIAASSGRAVPSTTGRRRCVSPGRVRPSRAV